MRPGFSPVVRREGHESTRAAKSFKISPRFSAAVAVNLVVVLAPVRKSCHSDPERSEGGGTCCLPGDDGALDRPNSSRHPWKSGPSGPRKARR